MELLLVVLVVALLAVIGAVVYQHYQPSNARSSTQTSTTHTGTTQTSPTTPQPATQYLTIKEWGIKMPLSDSIKDAYYVVGKGSSDGPGGPPTTMWLGLTSLSGPNCVPSNNDFGKRGALGAIVSTLPTDTDPVSGQSYTQEYPNGAVISGHYYFYQSWLKNNPCASESTLQPIDGAFAAAAKGIIVAN